MNAAVLTAPTAPGEFVQSTHGRYTVLRSITVCGKGHKVTVQGEDTLSILTRADVIADLIHEVIATAGEAHKSPEDTIELLRYALTRYLNVKAHRISRSLAHEVNRVLEMFPAINFDTAELAAPATADEAPATANADAGKPRTFADLANGWNALAAQGVRRAPRPMTTRANRTPPSEPGMRIIRAAYANGGYIRRGRGVSSTQLKALARKVIPLLDLDYKPGTKTIQGGRLTPSGTQLAERS